MKRFLLVLTALLAMDFMANANENDAWDLKFSFSATSGRQYGVVTDGFYIFTSAWSSDASHQFYQYDMQGNLVDEFEITGCGYLRDMTYDGQYFYGVDCTTTIYCVDFYNKSLVSTTTSEYGNMRAITYDPFDGGYFWVIGNWSGNLKQINLDGTVNWDTNVAPESISGLAYYKEADGSEHIYCFCNDDCKIYDYTISGGSLNPDPIFDFSATPGYNSGSSGGLFVGPYEDKLCLYGDIQQTPNIIGIYELRDLPLLANFNNGIDDGWKTYSSNDTRWYVAAACSQGTLEAYHIRSLYKNGSSSGGTDFLVSPAVHIQNAGTLSFAYATPSWAGDINNLSVGYSTAPDGPYTIFSGYQNMESVDWTTASINLSGLNGVYYFAFISENAYGYCTALDNISFNLYPINQVDITNFVAPVWGAHPNYDVTVPDGASYSISDVTWFKNVDQVLDPSDVFDLENAGYFMEVTLDPAPGYYFLTDATVSFNGDPSICDLPYCYVNYGQFIAYTIDYNIVDDVNDIAAESLGVYPNPAKDVLYINGLEQNTEVSIYNALGALVKVVNVSSEEAINVSELPTGFYIARFGENSVRFTKE